MRNTYLSNYLEKSKVHCAGEQSPMSNYNLMSMEYKIYHADNIYTTTISNLKYKLVGSIKAKSLNDAFTKSQNDFSKKYRSFDVRSTSVNDVFEVNNKYYLIRNTGFSEISNINIIDN